MDFVGAVNRILRSNGNLGADDDDVTFTDTAHLATITKGKIAIQDELNDLVSDNMIPYEVTTGSITTTASSVTYDLPADFVRFFGKAKIYYTTGNRYLYEVDMDALSITDPRFDVAPGEPNWWYFYPTTTKRIGLYQVPNATRVYTFKYEKSVAVENSSDTLPFHTEPEAQAFCQAATRRFKAMYEEVADVDATLLKDKLHGAAISRLINLMKGKNPNSRYGTVIR